MDLQKEKRKTWCRADGLAANMLIMQARGSEFNPCHHIKKKKIKEARCSYL